MVTREAEMDEQVKTTIRLPKSLLRAAKHWAVDHDCDLQDAVRIALEQLTKKGGK